MIDVHVGGLLGVIILIFDVWAIVRIVSSRASTGTKVFWVVLILLLPVVGLILWYIFGRRSTS